MKLYSTATVIDEYPGAYPPEDTGSSGLAVAKAGVQAGYFQTYDHAFGFDHFVASLQLRPVIVGTNWHEGMFYPTSDGFVRPTGSLAGGHEYLALGVDYETQTLTFLNSWGAGWAQQGRFKMTFADFTTLLGSDGDVTAPNIPVPVPTPDPTPTPEPNCCDKLKQIRKIVFQPFKTNRSKVAAVKGIVK